MTLNNPNKILSNTKLAIGITTALIGGYASRVHAGSCTVVSPSICTGSANIVTDITETVAPTGGDIIVTTNAGFGLNTSTAMGVSFLLANSFTDDSITFNDANSSSITAGAFNAFNVTNNGTGSTSITTSGAIQSASNGIATYNQINTNDLTITANGDINTTTGAGSAIIAKSYASGKGGGAISITTGAGTILSSTNSGIYAFSDKLPITIHANGYVGSSGSLAIRVIQQDPDVASPIRITTETIIGALSHGISVTRVDGAASDISITSNGVIATVVGNGVDINSNPNTSSNVNVTNNDDIMAKGGSGIRVNTSGDVTIVSNGTIDATGGGLGIVTNNIDGDVSVTTDALITANDPGIRAISSNGSTLITINGNVTSSSREGIDINSTNIDPTKAVTVTGAGNVTGSAKGAGINVSADHRVDIDVDGTISGNRAVLAISDNGPIEIYGTGSLIATNFDGVIANITNASAKGSITIQRDGPIIAQGPSGSGIQVSNMGSGDNIITVNNAVTPSTVGFGYGIISSSSANTLSTITLTAGSNVQDGILNNLGDSIIDIKVGSVITGNITLDTGSDNVSLTGGDFSGVTLLDGGDDASTADGFNDELIFQGSSGFISASNVNNWERIFVDAGSTVRFTNGTPETLDTAILDNLGGTVTTENNIVGDELIVTGDYSGGGSLVLEVNLGVGTADVLHVNGDTLGNTTISIIDLGTNGSQTTGSGILVIDVDGTSNGMFALDSSPIRAGNYLYELVKVGNNWYLQSHFSLAPPPTNGEVNIPTLSQWGQALLISMLGLFGLFGFKRRH